MRFDRHRRQILEQPIRFAKKGTKVLAAREAGYVFVNCRSELWDEAQAYCAWNTQNGIVHAVHPDDVTKVLGNGVTRLRDTGHLTMYWQ